MRPAATCCSSVPAAPITGEDLPAARQMPRRWASPNARSGRRAGTVITAHDLYRAILEGTPYPVRGLIGFGANMLLAHADPDRGRAALAALDFYAHADLFMTPTAALADVVLPVASCFEREALEDRLRDQHRGAVAGPVPPGGRAAAGRGALGHRIVFDLADALGLASSSGTATSTPPIATSSRRAASRWSSCAPHRPACGPAADAHIQARRARRAGQSARLRHTVAQGRALVGDLPRSRLRGPARFRRAADRPGDAPDLAARFPWS